MDTLQSWAGNLGARKYLELSVLVLEASLQSLVLTLIVLTRTLIPQLVAITCSFKIRLDSGTQ